MNLDGFLGNDGIGRVDVLGNAAWGWILAGLGADIIDAIWLPDWINRLEIEAFGGPQAYMDATENKLKSRGQLSADMFRKAREKDTSLVDEGTDWGGRIQSEALNGRHYQDKRDFIIRRLQQGTAHQGFVHVDFQDAGEEPLATSIGGGQLHYKYDDSTKEVELRLKDTYDFTNKGHSWNYLQKKGYLVTYEVDVLVEKTCISGVK